MLARVFAASALNIMCIKHCFACTGINTDLSCSDVLVKTVCSQNRHIKICTTENVSEYDQEIPQSARLSML